MENSNSSLGRPQPEMQDEEHLLDNGAGSDQQPGQYLSGGSAANAAHSVPQPEHWPRLPQGMRDRSQWCIAGADKAPLIAADGLPPASSTDPTTWRDFETACAFASRHGLHIGYMLHESDPFTCIDIDVKDDTPQEHIDRFPMIVEQANSYTERSRSGRGTHIWVEGKIGVGCKRDGVEVYSQKRFMICTGNVTANKPIEERQELLDNMVSQMRGQQSIVEPLQDAPEVEGDDAILERARNAENGGKFNAHYSADWQAIGHTDHSTADAALIGMLANYTRNNAQLKRLFLGSALGQRDKSTKRKDYVDRTINSVRAMQALEPNAAHGERIAAALIYTELLKQLAPKRTGVNQPYFPILLDADLQRLPNLRWLVKRIIPDSGVGAIYGPSGSCKSFLTLDLLAHISNGHQWFGHRVTSAPTVYVPFEGQGGVPKRVAAWNIARSRQQERDISSNIAFITERMNLRNEADRDKLVSTLVERGWAGGVLCIDTLAQAAQGLDENSSEGMGEMIAIFSELQHRLGGVVLVIHHTGKDADRGMRGWSGLLAALDFSIECKLGQGKFDRKFVLTKVKDDEGGKEFNFSMLRVHLGYDEDGDEITSLTVIPPAIHTMPEAVLQNDAARDAEDDDFIWNWVKREVAEGSYPSKNSLKGQLGDMKPHRAMTQVRVRDAIERLMADLRLAIAEEKSESGNVWIYAVDPTGNELPGSLG